MSFLESSDVEALKRHIMECMKTFPPPDNCGALTLMSWIGRHLTNPQLALLETIESAVGEKDATEWLWMILGASRPEGSSSFQSA